MNNRETMQKEFEALREECAKVAEHMSSDYPESNRDTAEAIRAIDLSLFCLASQTQQTTEEPVAWLAPTEDERWNVITPQHKANLSKTKSHDNYEKEYASRFTVPLYLQSQAQQEPEKCVQCGVRVDNSHCLGDIWNCSAMQSQAQRIAELENDLVEWNEFKKIRDAQMQALRNQARIFKK